MQFLPWIAIFQIKASKDVIETHPSLFPVHNGMVPAWTFAGICRRSKLASILVVFINRWKVDNSITRRTFSLWLLSQQCWHTWYLSSFLHNRNLRPWILKFYTWKCLNSRQKLPCNKTALGNFQEQMCAKLYTGCKITLCVK